MAGRIVEFHDKRASAVTPHCVLSMGDIQNPEMPVHFARYAGAVAERYPWVRVYTPVNEILVAARNSGLDGIWNERL